MKRHWYILVTVVIVATLILTSLAVARADTPQSTLADVLKALDVKPVPADHVIIVDTSASMTDAGRYQQVRDAIGALVGALGPSDRVTLVTFESTATVRFRGAPSPAVGAALPASPVGTATDIGAGIQAGVQELERADAYSRAALYLFTDGKIDAPTSPYATAGTPAWGALKVRAVRIQAAHEVAPYAISLSSSTDAALLREVFDRVVDVPAGDISSHLARVGAQLLKVAAIRLVTADAKRPVEMTVTGFSSPTARPSSAGTVVVRSANEHVPVVVTGAIVTAPPGWKVRLTGLDGPFTLAAGQSLTIPVTLTLDEFGPAGGPLTVELGVDSPWRNVLTSDLGLPWTATASATTTLASQPPPATASPPSAPPAQVTTPAPIAWPRPAVVGGLLALAAAFGAVLLLPLLRPHLVGSVAVLRDGTVLHEQILEGRRATLNVPDLGLRGSAAAVRRGPRSDTRRGVRLSLRAGAGKASGVLFDGEELSLGDVTVRYTSPRTRMLDLIATERP